MNEPRRIAPSSTDGTAYGHLVPVLEAELAWGNTCRDGFRYVPRNDEWNAHLGKPLHIDRLLAEFDFPPHIRVVRSPDGSTLVADDQSLVSLTAVSGDRSQRWGPPRQPRTGLLARILGP